MGGWTTLNTILSWCYPNDVRAFGAIGDGLTDDTMPIRAAISAARINKLPVYLPEGRYNVSPIGDTIIFPITNSVDFIGDGPNKTFIIGWCEGLKDPRTNWRNTGHYYRKIERFTLFSCLSNSSTGPVGPISFSGLTMDGQAGYTGDFSVGGIPETGDGWDISHKCLQFDGNQSIGTVTITDCILKNWRGEIVYSGGYNVATIKCKNTTIRSTNASAVSCGSIEMEDCLIEEVYQGIENFALKDWQHTKLKKVKIVVDTTRTRSQAITFIGVPGAYLDVDGCDISHCRRGILLSEYAHNVSVRNSKFSNLVHALATSQLNKPPVFIRFSNFEVTSCQFDITGSILSTSYTIKPLLIQNG